MELSVINISGKDTGRKISLPEEIFGIVPNEHAMYLDVKQYLANQRQGTHKSKERNEVAGSTKKIKKQKGTGGARAGSLKSPVFVGGGRIFGPRPRNYSFKLNKKVKRLARLSALSVLAKDGKVKVVDSLHVESAKTKNMLNVISQMNLTNKKVLLVSASENENLILSSRNLKKVVVNTASSLTTYNLLNCEALLLEEQGVNNMVSLFTTK